LPVRGAADWALKVRVGPKVEKQRYPDLAEALDALEERGRELESRANKHTLDLKVIRKFEPVQQVSARIELAGPGRVRAGVDVRGDGSSEGWTGRIRRSLIEQQPGETAYDALRRTLAQRG
jgi:hypothetical protein